MASPREVQSHHHAVIVAAADDSRQGKPGRSRITDQRIHEMGTARMSRDPKTSVLNPHNQVWDAPNVFVT